MSVLPKINENFMEKLYNYTIHEAVLAKARAGEDIKTQK